MKKYEQQTETKEKAQRAGFYMDKIRKSYAEKTAITVESS